MKRAQEYSEPAPATARLAELVAQAMAHHNSGRLSDAVACYQRIIQIRPDWADVYNNLGSVFEAQRKPFEAEASYQRAIALDPKNSTAHHNLGCLMNHRGELEQAAAHYQAAIHLKPDHAQAHSNLGNIFLDRGQLDEAESKYHFALSINPDDPATHNNLGNVWKARNKLEQATGCYTKAIALKPEYADAHNNLGCVLLDQGKLEAATECLRHAVRLKPDYAEAYCNLGVALQQQGKLEEATLCFERAIVLRPDYPEAWNNWGGVQKDLGLLDDATSRCERALVLCPGFAAAHCNLGSILQDQGRFAEAITEFRKALAIDPVYPEAHYNLSLLKTFEPDDPDLVKLHALAIHVRTMPPAKKPFIHFALAKALEDIGEDSRSFEQLLLGNKARRQIIHYDESKARNYLRQIAEVFDADLIDRCRGLGDPSQTPIFVLGMPRSGSTLVEQILASHPQIHGAGELTLLSHVANTPPHSYPATYNTANEAVLRELAANYLRGLPNLPPGKSRITDKMPGNFLYVGLIHLMLPNARIIHTVRNPADTCVSCFSKLFANGIPYSYDLAELGRYYRAYAELMEHWRTVLPANAMLGVNYEQVVEDLEGQARRLIEHCGLPWDDRCLSFHQNKRPVLTASNVRVRQPVFNSSINRWRRYESYLAPLISELRDQALSENAFKPSQSGL